MHLLVLYPLREELTILGSMIAHRPTYTTIWHSIPLKRLTRFSFKQCRTSFHIDSMVVGLLKNREAKKSEIPKKGKAVHTSIL